MSVKVDEIKKLPQQEIFDRVFGRPDTYFGEWFLKSDSELSNFLENKFSEDSGKLSKELCYLYIYLGAMNVLKEQTKTKEHSISNLAGKEVWYCNVLLLLIAWTDQNTKSELNDDGKIRSLKYRFSRVLSKLTPDEQKHIALHYGGTRKHKDFKAAISHIYGTRNYFAHDLVSMENVPEDRYFAFSSKKVGTFYPNLPHGILFLYVVIALLRYLGFSGKIEVKSEKEFKSVVDFMRES